MKSTETSFINGVKNYLENQKDILKLNMVNKSASSLSGIVSGIALFIIGLFILTFLSFTAAYAISEAIGKTYSGFLIVSAFYILLGVLIFLFKEKLVTVPIINTLLAKIYKKSD